MKLGSDRPYHLTYCSNIHAGESWSDVYANLQQYVPALKQQLRCDRPFGIGLRLADKAARALQADGDALGEFKAWLTSQDLYVFTLNGFPYGGFHRQVVKDLVYAPDWSQTERLEYTRRLVAILAELLPTGVDGGISTVPLSYKPWFLTAPSARQVALRRSCEQLAQLAGELAILRQETGKFIHLDLEPEPDCLLETQKEVVDFYKTLLLPTGTAHLSDRWGKARAEEILREHLQVCYDTCHFAVGYEDPTEVFAGFQAAGIQIGKIQLSAALKIPLPAETQRRHELRDRLEAFSESTYLHQVVERYSDDRLERYRDLTNALPFLPTSEAVEWRTHFHVPIFIEDYQDFQSTQADLKKALQQHAKTPVCDHLEIETYTWEVLPPGMKQDLLTSIQREYEWVLGNLA